MHTLLIAVLMLVPSCRSIESIYATIPYVANVDPIKHEALNALTREQLQALIVQMDECTQTDTQQVGEDYAVTIAQAARERLAQLPHATWQPKIHDTPVPNGLQWFFYTVMGSLIGFLWWAQFHYAWEQYQWRKLLKSRRPNAHK